ncbi:MAG TPA: hypothetical protein VJJ22_02365 [Candidatus Paceibacterota bacterium]
MAKKRKTATPTLHFFVGETADQSLNSWSVSEEFLADTPLGHFESIGSVSLRSTARRKQERELLQEDLRNTFMLAWDFAVKRLGWKPRPFSHPSRRKKPERNTKKK